MYRLGPSWRNASLRSAYIPADFVHSWYAQIEQTDVGQNLSPRDAEMRADLGTQWKQQKGAANDGWTEVQAFDGPGPETINSRLAML